MQQAMESDGYSTVRDDKYFKNGSFDICSSAKVAGKRTV